VVEFGVDLHGNTSIITKYQTEKCYGHLKKDDIVLICWFRMYKGLSLTPFCRYFRLSQGSKVSLFIGFEAFLFLRASHESSIDGTVYHMQHVIDSANSFKNGLNIMRKDSMGFFMD